MKAYEFHELANLFPPMVGPEIDEMAADIKTNGLKYPIVTFEGKILDGCNRYRACQLVEVEPTVWEYDGTDPIGYVLSQNLKRRHLSVKDRAEIAAKLANMSEGRPAGEKTASNEAVSETKAAEKLGVSRSSVQRAKARIRPPAKAKPEEKMSWSNEDLKADKEIFEALKTIDKAWGHDDARAIRTGVVGLSRKNILVLGTLLPGNLTAIHDLIMINRWIPKVALAFLNTMADTDSTVEDLQNWCLASEKKVFTADISGFRHTCELIKK